MNIYTYAYMDIHVCVYINEYINSFLKCETIPLQAI